MERLREYVEKFNRGDEEFCKNKITLLNLSIKFSSKFKDFVLLNLSL